MAPGEMCLFTFLTAPAYPFPEGKDLSPLFVVTRPGRALCCWVQKAEGVFGSIKEQMGVESP